MPFCHLKVILLISKCTSIILAQFTKELRRPLVILQSNLDYPDSLGPQ